MTISIWWHLAELGVWVILLVIFLWKIRENGNLQKQLDSVVWERNQLLQAAQPPLTAKELAAQKRVSVSTVARLAREGKIKAEKVGRQWRIAQGGE